MGEYKHSRVLFLQSDAQPIKFYILSSDMRIKLTPLIEYGGGIVTGRISSDAIRLIEPGCRTLDRESVSTRYILDCVEKNRLLNLDDYKAKSCDTSDYEISDFSDSESNAEGSLYAKRTYTKPLRKVTRREYTTVDDNAIICFILKNGKFADLKGNSFWKVMEKKGGLNRTWQSLKERFLKHVLPNIKNFNLTDEELHIFTKHMQNKPFDCDTVSKSSSYNKQKDMAILNYIFETNRIREVRGILLWKDMEKQRVTCHTWQSMKERFMKRILPNISKYGIPPFQLLRLRSLISASR